VIHLFHGKDDYRVRHAVRDIRDRLRAGDEMLESNTTVLEGRGLAAGELLAHATAMPFLASSRLVVVEGLLAALGEIKGGRRPKKNAADDAMEPWRRAAATLGDPATMPDTTTLVFVEGELKKTNAAFSLFAPIAYTVEYGPLAKDELPTWIDARAREKGVKLAPRAMASLAQLIGPDLWCIENELDKLAAYSDGAVVEPETVAEIVTQAQETKIWNLTDAIMAGDSAKALTSMRKLLLEGEPPTRAAFMVTRQFRQLALVKDMRERGARADDVARVSGVVPFRLSAVGAVASRMSWADVAAAYACILEADLSVKRGVADDESALQLLVHELCGIAPKGSSRPAYARPAYARPSPDRTSG
jgi:DNA polymerase-3 subunit delta